MRLLQAAVALVAAVVIPGVAGAECRLTQVVVPGIVATYDPFDTNITASPVTLSVQTDGDCAGARIELALGATTVSPQTGAKAILTQGSGTIAATVLAGGQPRPVVTSGAAFTTNPMVLPVGATGQVLGDATLALAIDPGEVTAPGIYTAQIALLARLTDAQGRQSLVSSPFALAVTVRPSVRVAAGAGDLSIDLGELRGGAIGGPVTFDAFANADYNLVLRSENGFVMRHGGTGAAPGVPYTPTLSNGQVALASGEGGAAIRQISFDAPADGLRRHMLRVRVNPFGRLPAGRYSDVLILEIRARV